MLNVEKEAEKMKQVIGYAVVVKSNKKLCFTDGALGTVWQIYTNKSDAEKFRDLPWGDAEYEVIEVKIENNHKA